MEKNCSYVFQKNTILVLHMNCNWSFWLLCLVKLKIIPQLMWMRNNKRDVPKANTEMINLEIKDWWLDRNFSNEKLNFLNENE